MINKIIGLMFVLTLTIGCITTTSANPDIDRKIGHEWYIEDGKIENAKVYQEGDKVCISGYHTTLDDIPCYDQIIKLHANYDNGLKLLSHGKEDYMGNTYPWDCYVGIPKTEYGRGESVYMATKQDGYFEIKLDAELIKRNDLQKITLEVTRFNNVNTTVFDRDVDGPIDEYLDKNY